MKYGILSGLLVITSASSAFALGPARDAARGVSNTVNNSHLTHTWESESCREAKELGSFCRVTYVFDRIGSQVNKIEKYFANEDECKLRDRTPEVEVRYVGTYKSREQIKENVYALNMNFKRVIVTPFSEAGRQALVGQTFCGNSAWEVNRAVDLTTFVHGAQCSLRSLPERVYDIYKVEHPRLYFGKDAEKATEYSRPIEIDTEVPFLQN